MKRTRHTPEQVIRKLREADRMLARGRLHFSERRACRLTGQHRSTQRHAPPPPAADDGDLRAKLREIAAWKPRWGYRRAHGHLRENGWPVNRKRVQRLWREEDLRVPQKTRKRRRTGDAAHAVAGCSSTACSPTPPPATR